MGPPRVAREARRPVADRQGRPRHRAFPKAAPRPTVRPATEAAHDETPGRSRDERRLMADGTRKLAVLIDADNTSPKVADGLFEEVAKIGEASLRRIYGDFSKGQQAGWEKVLARHAILAAAAVRLHHRQELDRHHAGHRRDGPAAFRPVRRLLPRLLRQRLHPPRGAHPRAGDRRLRHRPAEDAGEPSARPAPASSSPRTSSPSDGPAPAKAALRPMAEAVDADRQGARADGGGRRGLVPARRRRAAAAEPLARVRHPHLRPAKLSDLVEATGRFEINRDATARPPAPEAAPASAGDAPPRAGQASPPSRSSSSLLLELAGLPAALLLGPMVAGIGFSLAGAGLAVPRPPSSSRRRWSG